MKHTQTLWICLIFVFTSCSKDETKPTERFIGTYKTWKGYGVITDTFTTKVSQGKEPNLLIWEIKNESIELEILPNNLDLAIQTNFSIPLIFDNSASLTLLSEDTIEGFVSKGSIFFNQYNVDIYLMARQ